jgi:hypothetical protein
MTYTEWRDSQRPCEREQDKSDDDPPAFKGILDVLNIQSEIIARLRNSHTVAYGYQKWQFSADWQSFFITPRCKNVTRQVLQRPRQGPG